MPAFASSAAAPGGDDLTENWTGREEGEEAEQLRGRRKRRSSEAAPAGGKRRRRRADATTLLPATTAPSSSPSPSLPLPFLPSAVQAERLWAVLISSSSSSSSSSEAESQQPCPELRLTGAERLVESDLLAVPPPSASDDGGSSHPLSSLCSLLRRALPQWRSTLLAPPSLSPAAHGRPFVLVLCSSALRCLCYVRALHRLRLPHPHALVKAFSRHIRVEEAAAQLRSADARVVVGTPARVDSLITLHALHLQRCQLIVLDGAADGQRRTLDTPHTAITSHPLSSTLCARCCVPLPALPSLCSVFPPSSPFSAFPLCVCSQGLYSADAASGQPALGLPLRAPPARPSQGRTRAHLHLLTHTTAAHTRSARHRTIG